MALCSMLDAHFLRTVPSSALAGLVAPMSLRRSAMALSFSSARTTIGPLDINVVSESKKRTAGMHGIKTFCLLLVDFEHSHAKDPETFFLDHMDNVARRAFGHGVWFYDGKCALQCVHSWFLAPSIR